MEDKNDLVVMSNPVIDGRYSYTEIEAKILYTVISKIERYHDEFFVYEIEAKEIGAYKDVKKASISLYNKTFLIEDKLKPKNFDQYRLFSKLSYKDGYLLAKFDDEMKEFFLQIKKELGFTKFGLRNIMNLKSRYLIRIYTVFKKEQFKTLWEIDFKELCELLQVPKSYYLYKNFKKEILNKLNEINTKTDIFVSYQPIKKGRSIVRIKFIIQKDDFENFVKNIRNKYQKYNNTVILFEKDDAIFTLNGDGHIEKDDTLLSKELADPFWRFLYEKSKKEVLKFGVK